MKYFIDTHDRAKGAFPAQELTEEESAAESSMASLANLHDHAGESSLAALAKLIA